MRFVVKKEIFEELPSACFGVVMAKGIDNNNAYPEIEQFLDESIQAAMQRFEGRKVKEDPDILPYREAFRALNINPNKYFCSIEALFTRIVKGKGVPHINPVVDLGNAISLKYTLPMPSDWRYSRTRSRTSTKTAPIRPTSPPWRTSSASGGMTGGSSICAFPATTRCAAAAIWTAG